ncbi:hypothetical protein CYY_004375 [Polysphondylium violaceum]|uniref:Uncharacterized protein n=1 Tax=Polysphondylium violaceum TaxID=133409 RepID=A0A8J4PWB4_9MYCE|nr:hypothetical protein CYY_004375 [Polysphondylium violaceum]
MGLSNSNGIYRLIKTAERLLGSPNRASAMTDSHQHRQQMSQITDSLKSIIKDINCTDLYINEEQPNLTALKPKNKNTVYYYPILENNMFTLGIFAFPPHTHMPLHDHPQMTVLSKVLYGSVYCQQYDWRTTPKLVREAGEVSIQGQVDYLGESVITSQSQYKTTLPHRGNIHSFATKDEPAAMLDLLYPPYDFRTRFCTYYKPVELDNNNNNPTNQTSSTSQPIVFQSYSATEFNCEPGSPHTGLTLLRDEILKEFNKLT